MGSLWNRSGMVERYADDLPAVGAKAYFFNGGTTTPMSVFQDAGESAAHPFPLLADSRGRWPDVFIPYVVSFDVRVTTADDVQLTYTLQIPNPNPVDVTTTAPASQLVQTGMIHVEFVNTTKAGYVRLNGRTIGNAASAGSERANADTSALFTYLWNSVPDALAPVSAGRGGSAAADFAANKTIQLPDLRGTVFRGLDDMGNAAAGSFGTSTFHSGDAITPGSTTGNNRNTLSIANMPVHTHTGTTDAVGDHNHGGVTGLQSQDHTHSGTTSTDGFHSHTGNTNTTGAHTHSVNVSNNTLGGVTPGPTSGSSTPTNNFTTSSNGDHSHSFTTDGGGSHSHTMTTGGVSQSHNHVISNDGSHDHTFTTDSTGSGSSFNNMSNSILGTWFIKL